MRDANPLSPIAWRVFAALLVCLWIGFPAKSDTEKDRKKAAQTLAKEIEQGQFHKIYVPDFLDPSGTRTEKGCYFASAFSTDLAKAAHNFEIVNRIAAQKQLNDLHILAQALQQPEVLAKAATALGADAVLMGAASISSKDARLSLSLRDPASGKEVHAMDYHEKLKPSFEGSFPAGQSKGGLFYYFPGLDGISQPKCIRCPNPDYTDEDRRNGVQGSVLISATVDEKGTITDARVVESPHDGLTKRSLNILKNWQIEPSRDLEGNAVPIRTSIEILFRMLN